jgi:broad specificity phosphatase PhoE
MRAFAEMLRSAGVAAVWSSAERKARDGADILSEILGITPKIDAALGENDRASTGYIAPPEFWLVVEEFFANPGVSVRGWETAINAQRRIVDAVTRIAASAVEPGPTIIVSHGGVGRLLTAHLQGVKIGQEVRPENPGGGCFFTIDRARLTVLCGWRDIEAFNDSHP